MKEKTSKKAAKEIGIDLAAALDLSNGLTHVMVTHGVDTSPLTHNVKVEKNGVTPG